MEEENVTVCVRAGEVAGGEVFGLADCDRVGAETVWLEQPTPVALWLQRQTLT